MIERGADVNDMDRVDPDSEWSAVNSASAGGHRDIVKLLVESGADFKKPNKNGNTPLHSAAARGHLHVVKYLAEHEDATVEFLEQKNGNDLPAKALAAALDHDHVHAYLRDRAEELGLDEERQRGTNKPQ